MKAELGDDTYESVNFALDAVAGTEGWLNITMAGLKTSDDTAKTSDYENGVWQTFGDEQLDELITALTYYREYRTFKNVEKE